MPYDPISLEGRFLAGRAGAHGQVSRWIAQVLSRPRFRILRGDWGDLHQDVLQRIVESLRAERFDGSKDFRVYVQTIARYAARDALVRRIKGFQREVSTGETEIGRAPEPEDRSLARAEVAKILDGLSEDCRGLFRRFYYEEQGYAEIAEKTGVPVGTVKSRIFRCLARARKKIRGEPDGDRDTKE